MKCTTSHIIAFLILLVLSQSAIITYLLSLRQSNDVSDSSEIVRNYFGAAEEDAATIVYTETMAMDNSVNKSMDETQNLKTNENHGKSNDQFVQNYDGVAATLMINAPKWFQKRYSTMISNIFTNTPPNWAIQIFYIDGDNSQSQFGININPNLSRLNSTHDRIIFTPLPKDLVSKFGTRKKLLYWTDEWLWENLVADDVLVFNGNGVICSNGQLSLLDGSAYDRLFQHVDYVGSPWRSLYGEGGDGAFSYRNRRAMIDAIKFKPYNTKDGREDSYFLKNLKEMNKANANNNGKMYQIGTKEQTHLFAGNLDAFMADGRGPPPLPMVVSGTMPNLDHEVRQNVLAACPELGMMFPLLHHPSCFGAHPDGEECSKHVCALRPKSSRPSGC